MKTPPAWITYVTCGVAVIALIVSVATYVRAGPRVRIRWSPSEEWWSGGCPNVTVTVTNKGLAAVDVTAIILGFQLFASLIHIAELSESFRLSGEDLPLRLEPGSQYKWTFKVTDAVKHGMQEVRKLSESRPSKGTDKAASYILFWQVISRLSSGRPRFRFYVPKLLTRPYLLLAVPFSFMYAFGLVVSVHLGNGVQKTTLPSLRLTFWLNKLSDENRLEEVLLERPAPNPLPLDADKR